MIQEEKPSYSQNTKYNFNSFMETTWLGYEEDVAESSCEGGRVAYIKRLILRNRLSAYFLLAVASGVAMGFGLRTTWDYTDTKSVWYLEFPGRVVRHTLKLVMVPLVMTSLALATADVKLTANCKIVLWSCVYYFTTSCCAAAVGCAFAIANPPEQHHRLVPAALVPIETNGEQTLDIVLDFIGNMVPNNIITAFSQQDKTEYAKHIDTHENDTTNYVDEPKTTIAHDKINDIGLIVVSLVVGMVLKKMGKTGRPLYRLLLASNELALTCAQPVLWYAPIGLAFLIASQLIRARDWETERVGVKLSIHVLGLIVHGGLVLPLVLYVLTKRNPFMFFLHQLNAILTAWGTASSIHTTPVTFACLIKNNRVNKTIVTLVASIGATVNHDGSALYVAMSAVYMAQVKGIDLSYMDLFYICVTTAVVSCITMGRYAILMILSTVGLPEDGLAGIQVINWLLDGVHTMFNVWGDHICAGVLHHFFDENMEIDKPDYDAKGTEFEIEFQDYEDTSVKLELEHRAPSDEGLLQLHPYIEGQTEMTHEA